MANKFVWNAGVFDGAPLYASPIATAVSVVDSITGNPVDIWSDELGLIPKANPFTLDEPGKIEFYADIGRYNITASNGINSQTWNNELVGTSLLVSEASASYALSKPLRNVWTDITGAANIDITCPLESTVNLGGDFIHTISNFSTGTVQFVAEGPVTLITPPGRSAIVPQNATVGVKKLKSVPDSYVIYGPTQSI